MSTSSLNESDDLAGQASFPNNEWQACIWSHDGEAILLPLFDTAQVRRSTAVSISDSATLIAGSSVTYLNTGGL